MGNDNVVRVYMDKTVKSKITDRMKKLRAEIEKLPKEKTKEIIDSFIGISGREISAKRMLDILFSEMSEDPYDEPGLIYIGNVEALLQKIKQKTDKEI